VSLRAKTFTYLCLLHAAFAAAVLWAAGGSSVWLVAVEVAAVVSLLVGLRLADRALRSLALGDEAARLIREGEFTARLRPVGDGRVDRLIDVYNAMVDTLRNERARVQEQHHFLGQVIGVSPSGMVVLDFDGHVSDVNPAGLRLLGLDRDAVIGRTIDALSSPVADALARLGPGAVEVIGLSGARRLRCHRGAFMDRGFSRTFFVIEELTEEARRIERAAYEKLIRVMSHEVNNSITASNSLLESSLTYAAELPPSSRADLEHALRIAIDRSTQLNQFLRRFADVFRLPAPHREPTDLRALMQQLVTLTRARTQGVRVECAWTDDAQPVWVNVDRGQFEQACLNVLKNAVEAAGPGGWVTVGVASTSEGAMISIDDSGPGPGPEAEAHLFTPFFSTKPHGQGIGLTLVREILSGHGWDYALEHPAGGPTRFTMWISADRRAAAVPRAM
jgi:two-component system nitrogen regulation sensor histidine kinase NtrY